MDLGSLIEAKNDATLDVIHDLSAASDDFKIEENEEKVLLLTSKLEQVDDEIRAIGRDSRTVQEIRAESFGWLTVNEKFWKILVR